jgi:hypothetical protein
MALYTSTQDGNWSNAATWGGAGTPSINGDQASIGHDVTYDLGDSVIEFNDVTVTNGGVLIFPTSSDSTIKFDSTGILTVNSGGELRAGTSGTPVNGTNHCYFHFPQGVAARFVVTINDGGIVNIYGDPSFYGSTKYATLESAWDANATLTLYVEGDLSSTWQAGQLFWIHKNVLLFWIHKNVLYSDYQTDGEIFTIQSVGVYDSANNRTPITVTNKGAGASFADSAPLIMVSRNVELIDPGMGRDVGDYVAYVERIRFQNLQGSSNTLINIYDSMFVGWDRAMYGGENIQLGNGIFLNNSYGLTGGYAVYANADFISNGYASTGGTRFNITGKIVSNNYAINTGEGSLITGDFISNQFGLRDGRSHKVIGNFISNSTGIDSSILSGTGNYKVDGNFIYNDTAIDRCRVDVWGDFISNTCAIKDAIGVRVIGDFTSNTADFSGDCTDILIQAANFSTGFTYSIDDPDVKRSVVMEDCQISGVRRPLRVYENAGSFLPLMNGDSNWIAPPSGENWVLKATPNSYCSTYWLGLLDMSPLRDMRQYMISGNNTIRAKIYPVGWTTQLNQDDLFLEALYLSGLDLTKTKVVTGTSVFTNGIWSEVTVSFNAAQTGIVYFNLYLTRYEAGCYILIDPLFLFV